MQNILCEKPKFDHRHAKGMVDWSLRASPLEYTNAKQDL